MTAVRGLFWDLGVGFSSETMKVSGNALVEAQKATGIVM